MRPHPYLLLVLLGSGCPATNIADALHRCDNRLPDIADDPEGTLHRVTVTGTDAHCNDGTPPVMAIQAATDLEHADDWVVFFEAGKYCASGSDCVDRWCGVSPPYNARLMSSDFFPDQSSQDGLFADVADNAFRGWNKAFLHYCSSDSWLGTQTEEVALRDGSPNISLWFQGDRIVDALMNALDEGVTSDDGAVTTPPLVDAKRLMLAGASAGATGLAHHLDRLAARYPDTDVRGSFDGLMGVDYSLYTDSERSEATKAADYRYETLYQDTWNARTEDQCSKGGCFDVYSLLSQDITTPYSLRDDVQDPEMLKVVLLSGVDSDRAGELLSASARHLAEDRPGNSVLESACQRHIITTDDLFYTMEVGGLSMADNLRDMWRNQRNVEIDSWPGTESTCR
ncbi:MAG: hypothetical protein H6738_23390 [Alphaproteobacteria bacterium]|nr:hypothetical protein [Alphaproteobacteria bacterium]MCB9699750.1 hypothetical protein [Alphaproteobacteria bacterium]